MENNESTIRWLKKRYKNLSEEEITERASRITKKYLKENLEKLEEQAKFDEALFAKAIDQELLSLKIN